MKKETLDHFLGKEVTIKFFDNEIAKGFLTRNEYRKGGYLLKRFIGFDIAFRASHVKRIE